MLWRLSRGFEDDGNPPRCRMPEQFGERLRADLPVADPLVVVAIRAARILGIVGVHELQPPATDRANERIEGGTHPARRREVVSGCERMAGVEADPDPRMVVERRQIRPEVFDRCSQRLTGAGRRLDQ